MTFHQLMRRGLSRGLAALLLLASPLLASTGGLVRADSGASVWVVRGERNNVYLAGSVHALPRDHAQFSPQLEQAYDASDAIVMEVDLDDLDPFEAVRYLASNGMLPESQTLADVVGKDEYASVARLAQSIDLPEMAIARLEPWAAAMLLTQFALLKTGFDPQLGIDMQLTERARTDGKPIDGLETIGDQLGIFDSRSQQEQIRFLLDAADDVPEMQKDLDRLVAAWRTGDLRALEHELQKERANDPRLYDELLGARNRKWLPKIEALLDDDRSYLVVVGALHFVGRDGLLELLKRAGHRPTSLTLKSLGAN
jgi:uncharacterized protein YbaP (TraB family)